MYIDLLIKIKNAQAAGKKLVKSRFTKTDKAVSEILQQYGFVAKSEIKGRLSKRFIFVDVKGSRPISGIRLISKPSVRRYAGYRDLRPVKGGYGTLVLSTPKGITTMSEARREKIGGELLFEIW